MDPGAKDERAMRRAIQLSRRGYPAPNPHVGCVIVSGGEIVGEGWHAYAGGPHAEVVALERAGPQARGAEVFVTLEPCNHSGRTGPCSQALLDAGVARVVAACADPNPVARGGLARLQMAGVTTDLGLLADEAADANLRFLTAMKRRRPYVVAKAALSADGRTALSSGESRWLTSEAARAAGRRLRAEMGAVLVGRGTVEADDPQLTARVRGSRNEPVRIVLDPGGRLTGRERVFREPGEVIQVVQEAERGAGHQLVAPYHGGEFHLPELLSLLFRRGITGVLVEGGAKTLGAFVRAGLVDRYELFLAPLLLGSGPAWVNDLGIEALVEAPRLTLLRSKLIGPDLWLTLTPA